MPKTTNNRETAIIFTTDDFARRNLARERDGLSPYAIAPPFGSAEYRLMLDWLLVVGTILAGFLAYIA